MTGSPEDEGHAMSVPAMHMRFLYLVPQQHEQAFFCQVRW